MSPAYHRVTVKYSLGTLQIRREFRIYSGCPAVACDTWVRGSMTGRLASSVENNADRKNIEFAEDMASRPVSAVIDRVSLPGNHWHGRAVEFWDVTDWNNNLVTERDFISYRKNSYRGNILFLQDGTDGSGLFFLKEAPCSSVQLEYGGADFIADFGTFSVTGPGISTGDVSQDKWTRIYSCVMGVWSGSEFDALSALRLYQKNVRRHIPGREEMAAAAKACIDLNVYSLESDFANIFWQSTGSIPEKIFSIPRSIENGVVLDQWFVNNGLPRNAGGYGSDTPSWDLFASFLCTDGLPIDESPLFDPCNPFENRDPRCAMTIVEFDTEHCGFIYNPRHNATTTINTTTGQSQTNNDCRAVAQYASYNGLLWKKGIDISWTENGKQVGTDYIIMRYADVLLMYAEAKIELGEIDDTVLDAINQVRARAYGVNVASTGDYPAVTTMDQAELRRIVRLERRMEFAKEGRRYMDLIRWKLAEKALNGYNYIMLNPEDGVDKIMNTGLWFWGAPDTNSDGEPENVITIDEDGLADFSALYDLGLCQYGAKRVFPERQYLWPIPTHDNDLVNGALGNNPGY